MTKFKDTSNCANCITHHSIFGHLSKAEMNLLNKSKHEVHFKAGETIFKQGSALTHIACLNSGMAKLYIEGTHNKNLIIKLLQSPDVVIGPGIFLDQRHHYSVSAVTNLSACFIDIKSLLEVLKTNNDFALELLRDSTLKRIRNYEQLINLTQKQMSGRIAETILYLSKNIYKSHSFTVDISRQDIADLSAMSKESAIRIIKEFKDAYYLKCEGNKFDILDPDALLEISLKG